MAFMRYLKNLEFFTQHLTILYQRHECRCFTRSIENRAYIMLILPGGAMHGGHLVAPGIV